jgi:tetratricopeptide (TPR) repeat protein
MKNLKIIIPIFLILVITLVTFYPCLKNSFTNWDDDAYVIENKAIRSITLTNLKTISTSFFVAHYQPVTIFSYLLEYHFFKLNPFNYHLTNLILHLFNCLLVFWIIYLLTASAPIAGLTVILFGIHPMQVESVAWISERKNLLYTFFYLGAMISYLYYLRKDKRLKYYFLCLGLFILALLSKSVAFTLPLVLLLLDYFTSRKITIAVLIEKIPFLFLSLIFGLVALWGSFLSTVTYDKISYSLFTKLTGASSDIIFYLNKLFLPFKLSVLYSYPEIKHNPVYLYYFVLVIILFAAVIFSKQYSKKVILGSGIFLLTIFPAIRFLALDDMLVADRYVYLPAIGIFYLIAEGLIWLWKRQTRYSRLFRIFLVSALALVIVLLSFFTWQRCQVWKDSLSLWNNVLENYPDIAKAHVNRGEFFLGMAEYDKARSDFITALSLDYHCCEAYFNLAILSDTLGDDNEAIKWANRALRVDPAYLKTHALLIVLYGKTGRHSAVVVMCKNLIKIKPDSVEAYANLCSAYGNLGNYQEAIACGRKAVGIDPHSALAHLNLSVAYFYTQQYDLAVQHYNEAVKLGYKVSPEYVAVLKKCKI